MASCIPAAATGKLIYGMYEYVAILTCFYKEKEEKKFVAVATKIESIQAKHGKIGIFLFSSSFHSNPMGIVQQTE